MGNGLLSQMVFQKGIRCQLIWQIWQALLSISLPRHFGKIPANFSSKIFFNASLDFFQRELWPVPTRPHLKLKENQKLQLIEDIYSSILQNHSFRPPPPILLPPRHTTTMDSTTCHHRHQSPLSTWCRSPHSVQIYSVRQLPMVLLA